MKKHLHKGTLCFNTTSSPLAPIFIFLSDLTDVCQRCHVSLLSVTDLRRARTLSSLQAEVTQTGERLCFSHSYSTHMSQGVWIVLQLVKAEVFLQEIVSLHYGLENDRRPEAE